jgi:predicted enzyme related to lactoylglutathione lyase
MSTTTTANTTSTFLSAMTMHSQQPERLAGFYRDVVGLPLAPHTHGTLSEHHEGYVNGVHFAVWKASEHLGGPFVPVFRVDDLAAAVARLQAIGVPMLHKPLDIGEGKRVCGFKDPDGNAFRLIEIR